MVLGILAVWFLLCAAVYLIVEWKTTVVPALGRFGKKLYVKLIMAYIRFREPELRRAQRRWLGWNREITALIALALCLISIMVITLFRGGPWFVAQPSETAAAQTVPAGEAEPLVYAGLNYIFSVLEGDSAEFREHAAYAPLSSLLAMVISLLVPVLTAAAAALLLWNHLPHHVPWGGNTWYIFSELEPNAIRMARSIQDKHAVFLFLRTRPGKQEPDTLKELQPLRYLLYPRDESRFLLWRWRRAHRMRFFFLSENTDTNFERMQDFLREAAARKLFTPVGPRNEADFQQELYLLSETESAPMLIDHLRRQLVDGENAHIFANTELHLLDRFRAVSYDLLMEKPLCEFRKTAPDGTSKLNVLIVGFGKIGREFFRAASSMGIIHNCTTEFTIYDLMIHQKMALFQSQCPELEESVKPRQFMVNADSQMLERLIENEDFHYILVALGDDERNIRVVTRLKGYYRRKHWSGGDAICQPQICVNIEDSIKHEYITTLWKARKTDTWDRSIHVFGGLDQAFTQEVLMPEKLWRAARWVHRHFNKTSGSDALPLDWSEYQRRSSIACAAHAAYHAAAVEDAQEPYDSILAKWKENKDDQPKYTALVDTEHRRWMAYVRSEGMRLATFDQVEQYYASLDPMHHVDQLGSLTPCLVDSGELDKLWKDLEALDKRVNKAGRKSPYAGNYTFHQRDQLLVLNAAALRKYIDDNVPPAKTNTDFFPKENAAP